MQRLEACNDILRRIGSLVVPALDTGGTSLHAQSERQLDDVDLRIQSLGWSWNRRGLTLSPDATGQIPVTAVPASRGDLLEIDTRAGSASDGIEVVVSNGLLARLPEMSRIFTSDLEVTVIERIPFEEVPVMFATWMVAEAAFDTNRRYMQDAGRDQALAMEKMQARVNAMRQALRLADVNVLATPDIQSVHGRRRLPNWSVYQ